MCGQNVKGFTWHQIMWFICWGKVVRYHRTSFPNSHRWPAGVNWILGPKTTSSPDIVPWWLLDTVLSGLKSAVDSRPLGSSKVMVRNPWIPFNSQSFVGRIKDGCFSGSSRHRCWSNGEGWSKRNVISKPYWIHSVFGSSGAPYNWNNFLLPKGTQLRGSYNGWKPAPTFHEPFVILWGWASPKKWHHFLTDPSRKPSFTLIS